MFFKLIKVHLLVRKLYIYQNAGATITNFPMGCISPVFQHHRIYIYNLID